MFERGRKAGRQKQITHRTINVPGANVSNGGNVPKGGNVPVGAGIGPP
jgi:hypothetical protein